MSDDHRARSAALHADRPVRGWCRSVRGFVRLSQSTCQTPRHALRPSQTRSAGRARARRNPADMFGTRRCYCCNLLERQDWRGRRKPDFHYTDAHFPRESRENLQAACSTFRAGRWLETARKDLLVTRQVASSFRRRLDTCGPRSGAAVRGALVSATVLGQTRTGGWDGQEATRQ